MSTSLITMVRVVIADDHHLVRQGIRALLEKANDIDVVGEAADGQEAVELVEKLVPDVLVIDISMPRLGGLQAIERVRGLRLPTQIVMLSMHSDEVMVRQALRKGARGYLLKRSVTEELLLAIRAASRSETYLSPAISRTVLEDFLTLPNGADMSPLERLSPREREVLQLIAEGKTNSAIAGLMKISVKTVEKHRASLMAKLKVHDMVALVRIAIKHGLVTLDN
ncbi:MAG: response regulator transcription factor [Chloroflexi bacterium]|nr:response regulator transcription factor [Chloroflexota bacterium]